MDDLTVTSLRTLPMRGERCWVESSAKFWVVGSNRKRRNPSKIHATSSVTLVIKLVIPAISSRRRRHRRVASGAFLGKF